MKVILLNDLYKHGVAGEIVKVADGFARNYLIPRKMARRATDSALRETEAIRKNVEARRAQYDNMLNELAQQIDGVELVFGRRAASTGKLFGSVTTQEVADALLEQTEVDLNRRRISQHSLREIGIHNVTVRLGSEISPTLIVIIVPEDELQGFLVARERGIEIKPEDLLDENFSYPKFEAEVVEDTNDVEIEALSEEAEVVEDTNDVETEVAPEEVEIVEDTNDLETEVIPEEVVQEALDMETTEESDESDE